MTIHIMVVDDHSKIHRAITALVDVFDDLVLVGHASTGEEAIQLCRDLNPPPDVVIMDVIMPGMGGIEATRQILQGNPQLKILALSSFQDEDSVRGMLQAGAIGYVLKNSSIDDLANTIRTAYAGKAVFSTEVTQALLQPTIKTEPKMDYGLTERELEVLTLMIEGANNNQIAEKLFISISTAKFHVSSILGKLNVGSRVEAVALAVSQKLVN
jgi:two-component system, NarL family, response regulator LiaR